MEGKPFLPRPYGSMWGDVTRTILPDSLPTSLVVGNSTIPSSSFLGGEEEPSHIDLPLRLISS